MCDEGLFGPQTVTWQLHADPAMWFAGICSLYLQALHPQPASGESRICSLPVVSMADVADRDAQWIVIDDQVLDVTEFTAQHPGGCAVMYANIGRDASRDYHHVSAHHRKSVARKIEQLGVARIDPRDRAEDSPEWQRLLDYLCLFRNSFAVQRGDTRDPGS